MDRTTSSPTNGTGRETRRNIGGIDDDLACMFGYSLERHHRAIVLSVQLVAVVQNTWPIVLHLRLRASVVGPILFASRGLCATGDPNEVVIQVAYNGCWCVGGSVAEWLACWTHAQKGPGSNRSRDAVG